MRLKNHANEETTSAGNVQMNGPSSKRKRSNSNNCHECHRNGKGIVVRCTKCKQKNYCIPCITKWYTGMQETDFAEACPVCRNICNWTACFHSDVANEDVLIRDLNLSISERTQYSRYIVRVLSSLMQFVVEQTGREEEARIRGLSVQDYSFRERILAMMMKLNVTTARLQYLIFIEAVGTVCTSSV